MTLIFRALLVVAAAIAALFVSRDAANFSVIETLIAISLIALTVLVAALWGLRSPGNRSGAS